MSLNGMDTHCKPRLCHLIKWPDFNGYGFNLHAEKGKAGQYIGKVDDGSPAQAAGLKDGDRIVEVNGVNIGNENHQQVVSRVKAGGEETRMLVVDNETDQHYKDERKVVRGDLPEVVVIHCPPHDTEPEQAPPSYTEVRDEEPVTEVVTNTETSFTTSTSGSSSEFISRLCHIKKRADFNGYGFNLHAERDKPGQFIGKIDEDSPAERADLREGDRIVAVNGTNIESETHQRVIELVKSGGDETTLLVVDKASDEYFKSSGITVSQDMSEVRRVSSVPGGAVSVPVEPPVFSIPPPPIEDPSDDEEFNVDDFNEAVQEQVEATQAAEVEAELPPPEDIPSPPEDLVTADIAENDQVEVEQQLSAEVAETVEAVADTETSAAAIEEVEQTSEEFADTPAEVMESLQGIESELENEVEVAQSAEVEVEAANDVHAEVTEELTENNVTEITENVSSQVEENVVEQVEENADVAVETAEDAATSSVNGQSVTSTVETVTTYSAPEPEPEPTPAPAPVSQPEPTPEPTPEPPKQANGTGDIFGLSAKEMKERLKSRRKVDPRTQGVGFGEKYKVFERL
ncbi:Na(+)/H(+) exchange regulatory cofactor NHE-RF1-like isoform X2 [Haliotis rubra]|uniref:Na(+)/H(+) exchange regulatory cofactor NHE-RF1-like isoform X2 n=1 Tax=Haliotis rubra TaxID=36100 RepID=UPI001EE53FB8|nr:Na(+)/H(+) exchange regulatory cofactor NHE-RF1-like isoform X2 [Haliotis rubra]